VAEFIGSPKMNLFAATVVNPTLVEVAGIRLSITTQATPGLSLKAGVRPEVVTVSAPKVGQPRAIVKHTENLGSDILVHLEHPGSPERRDEHTGWRGGEPVIRHSGRLVVCP
jgi:multiple sugar transport system ATP-binding protein